MIAERTHRLEIVIIRILTETITHLLVAKQILEQEMNIRITISVGIPE